MLLLLLLGGGQPAAEIDYASFERYIRPPLEASTLNTGLVETPANSTVTSDLVERPS